ncbi:MAG: DUF3943 domain-containing protein [Flavobacterium sp.]
MNLKIFTYCLVLSLASHFSFAQQSNNFTFKTDSVVVNSSSIFKKDISSFTDNSLKNQFDLNLNLTPPNQHFEYPPSYRDYKKLGLNSMLYFGTAAVMFGVLYAAPESVTKWDKAQMRKQGITYKWVRNVNLPPVVDQDSFTMNYIAHPYCGGIYYMSARSSGFKPLECFLYSAFMSTFFWEYGIESFAERPSVQDLIITPALGSFVGEAFFYAKKSIIKNDKKILNSRALAITTLVLIDPFNTMLDGMGYKSKNKAQLGVQPVGFDYNSKKPILGLNFNVQF